MQRWDRRGTARAQVLAKIVEAKQSRSEQAQLFLRMHIAQYQLALGERAATKALVEAATEELASLHDVRCPKKRLKTPAAICLAPAP